MKALLLLLLSIGLAWGAWMHSRRDARPPTAARRALPPVAASPAPREATVEWDGPRAEPPKMAADSRRGRLRDRYIQARFPGVFRGGADLERTEYAIKVARHFFEEGDLDSAGEIFALAIEQAPEDLPLRLAELEIAYLARDRERYSALARALRECLPACAEWDQVARLGRAIAPADPLFAAPGAASAEDHYGPWPNLPNWIHASWDLTPEVLAADFHRAMKGGAEAPAHPAHREAA